MVSRAGRAVHLRYRAGREAAQPSRAAAGRRDQGTSLAAARVGRAERGSGVRGSGRCARRKQLKRHSCAQTPRDKSELDAWGSTRGERGDAAQGEERKKGRGAGRWTKAGRVDRRSGDRDGSVGALDRLLSRMSLFPPRLQRGCNACPQTAGVFETQQRWSTRAAVAAAAHQDASPLCVAANRTSRHAARGNRSRQTRARHARAPRYAGRSLPCEGPSRGFDATRDRVADPPEPLGHRGPPNHRRLPNAEKNDSKLTQNALPEIGCVCSAARCSSKESGAPSHAVCRRTSGRHSDPRPAPTIEPPWGARAARRQSNAFEGMRQLAFAYLNHVLLRRATSLLRREHPKAERERACTTTARARHARAREPAPDLDVPNWSTGRTSIGIHARRDRRSSSLREELGRARFARAFRRIGRDLWSAGATPLSRCPRECAHALFERAARSDCARRRKGSRVRRP